MIEWNILAKDQKTKDLWTRELKTLQRGVGDALGKMGEENELTHQGSLSSIILVDVNRSSWQAEVQSFDRSQFSVVLVMDEKEFLPPASALENVDDVLVYPFRMAELLSKVRAHYSRHYHRQAVDEMKLAQEDMHEVNQVLERILHVKTPKMYTGIKGVEIMSRHLSGLKPGGDYFDIFESEKKDFVNILLADSSSYGVSSALLGMILSSSAKIASDANMNTAAWIRAIYEEMKITLGDQEHLSIFFGRIDRRSFALHYQLYGSIEAFVVEKSGEVNTLEKHGRRINAKSEIKDEFEKTIHLDPKDRIVLLSDGFVNGVGGEFSLQKIFHDKIEKEPFELVNELAFQIKSRLVAGETFPGEDCSAIVIDVDQRVLRLAPTG